MSFFCPEFGIKHYDHIPTLCSGCSAKNSRQNLSQKTKEMLIEASYFHSFTVELKLLKRLQDLIELFPDSNHPLIQSKHRKSKRLGESTEDASVEYVLNHDQELRRFLTDHSFDVDARKSFVEDRLNAIRFLTGHPDISCKHCGAYSYLPESFLTEVGLFLERQSENAG